MNNFLEPKTYAPLRIRYGFCENTLRHYGLLIRVGYCCKILVAEKGHIQVKRTFVYVAFVH